MNILDQEAPGLSSQLCALSLERWRHVAAKACESVSQSIDGLEPSFKALLSSAVEKNKLSPEQIAEARMYAKAADDRYFTFKEDGASQVVWRNWFAKARLATALADAFSGATSDKAADAMYELCFVEEDKSAVLKLVRSEIMLASKTD